MDDEASLHAAQNERLPVRAVIQVLFSSPNKPNSTDMSIGAEASVGRGVRTQPDLNPRSVHVETRNQRSTNGDKEDERRAAEGPEPMPGDADANGGIDG
ncbi:hypothetical protein V6N13_023921 [Hibiscus sabdariffa]|uniref:NPH3 domain-containing protein n=1 Tax=Hibiscus sabdariffa TaxID=183260 RepID=A0ABR2PN72_9ROSI